MMRQDAEKMEQEKQALRHWAKAARRNLSSGEKAKSDGLIADQVLRLPVYKGASSVFIYVAHRDEVETRSIIVAALEAGKTVGVPRVTGPGAMEVRQIQSLEDLKPGCFGLLEPEGDLPLLAPEDVKLSIVPCLTADRNGGRLGMGGGYYDRFLPRTSAPRIALCRQFLLSGHVPMFPHDVVMDGVVTEETAYGV